MKIDFICVGFPKCGTTTLDSVLRQHTKLSFPEVKEIGFFSWCKLYKEPYKELSNYYQSISDKIVGGIEPAYYSKAENVYSYFGNDVKIIFMMRNPVDRLFSDFRMKLRNGSEGFKYFYKKYKSNEVSKMFDRYVEEKLHMKEYEENLCDKMADLFVRSDYIKWIKEFQKYYKPENIKLVFFEEYIKEPEKILEDIQEFIGVEKQSLNYNIRENGGKQISKNYFCANINKWCYKVFLYFLVHHSMPYSLKKFLRKVNQGLWHFVGRFTLVDNVEKMSKETKIILQDYYRDSVKELEKCFDISLTDIWFA